MTDGVKTSKKHGFGRPLARFVFFPAPEPASFYAEKTGRH